MAAALLDEVRRAIAAQRLLPARSRVVIGVSGGADSVALLELLRRLQAELRLTLIVAHLDHGFREASGEDAAFVRELAATRGLTAVVERRDVRAACATGGWSLEDGARRIRYAFLQRVADSHSASRVALAHTADDQVETVVMRLLGGTGLLGLGGIRAARPLTDEIQVVRPLLGVTRAQILDFLSGARLAYREDASNRDPAFLRNRIRHDLLPLLERDYNPRVRAALLQLAEQSQTDYEVLEAAARRVWRRLSRSTRDGSLVIATKGYLAQPEAVRRQLLRRAIHDLRGEVGRIEFRHWLEVDRLFRERPAGTVVSLPGGVEFLKEPAHVVGRLAPA